MGNKSVSKQDEFNICLVKNGVESSWPGQQKNKVVPRSLKGLTGHLLSFILIKARILSPSVATDSSRMPTGSGRFSASLG